MANFWSPNNSDTALCNFWRGVENINLKNTWAGSTTMYAVSQAAPIRRVHVDGNLDLFSTASGMKGWSSGGYMADSVISGRTNAGTQQQWFNRNVDL
jgi:hypothetical protein